MTETETMVATKTITETATTTLTVAATSKTKPSFVPGVPKPNYKYKKAVIVSAIKKDDTSWVGRKLPDVDAFIYVNDDPKANLTVPENKGYEAMAYLTFIIDHYDHLPEIMIFIHAHEGTHHNPWLLQGSTPEMIKTLSAQRVIREGYMNLHCGRWDERSCPAMIRPAEGIPMKDHARAWHDLFPEYPLPQVLAQACCSQFAVSRERILQIPLATFQHMRQWMLETDMSSAIIGYVFEYLWQFIFKGEHVYCPSQSACYCDGYGMCLGERFSDFNRMYIGSDRLNQEIERIDKAARKAKAASTDGNYTLPKAEAARRERMLRVSQGLRAEMRLMRDEGRKRGQDPRIRAEESGRAWKEGDGFN